jgi:hypothetical protein
MITNQQIHEALKANAQQSDDGLWGFHGGHPFHTEDQALAITRACLILGVPVTDVLSSTTWGVLVDRLAEIERRLETVEMGGAAA